MTNNCICKKVESDESAVVANQEMNVEINGIMVHMMLNTAMRKYEHGGYVMITDVFCNDNHTPVATTSVDVEYCPFCGEKLM